MLVGVFISAIPYRGKEGERYSPLNHYISELGEVGVSIRPWGFNISAILCGILLLPAPLILTTLFLGRNQPISGILALLGALSSLACLVGLIGVGLFSMDKGEKHVKTAMLFFRGGLLMVLFYSLAFLLQDAMPRTLSLLGLPAVLAFAGFLILMQVMISRMKNNPLAKSAGPRKPFVALSALEWLIFVCVQGWFLGLALLL